MRPYLLACCSLAALALGATQAAPRREDLKPAEAQQWLRYVCPLPQRANLEQRLIVDPREVQVICTAPASPTVDQIRAELDSALRQEPGTWYNQHPPTVRIILEVGGGHADPLLRVPHSDQAYRIFQDEDGLSVRIAALTPRGLYYGAKTLQQLATALGETSRLTLPVGRITDWPDMEDRGTWGADNFDHLRWLADRKLNLVEQISFLEVTPDGVGHARLKPGREPMVELGPKLGIKPVPVVVHLEQLSGKGLFEAYPNLLAKGGQEGSVCYSQPQFVKVLADWIGDLGALPGVESVDVWMTENLHGQGGCQCGPCQGQDRSVQEAQTIVTAWREAQQRGCRAGLRVLTSEETRRSNQAILAALPPDVKFWYYESLLTYTSLKAPMIEGYLAQAAEQGRWIGVCPSLNTIHFLQPFTSPQFVKYRLDEYTSKHLSGLLAYVTPRTPYAALNLEAAAEWSWNARGRSVHEFARAHAVRRRMEQPDKFADWCDLLGPVTWNVYGSAWPTNRLRGTKFSPMQALLANKLPEMGEVLWGVYPEPWGQFGSAEQLSADWAAAKQAIELAQELKQPAAVAESRVMEGYLAALAALWRMRGLVTPEGIIPGREVQAASELTLYTEGLDRAAQALPEWAQAAAPEMDPAEFLNRPLETLAEMKAEAEATRGKLLGTE